MLANNSGNSRSDNPISSNSAAVSGYKGHCRRQHQRPSQAPAAIPAKKAARIALNTSGLPSLKKPSKRTQENLLTETEKTAGKRQPEWPTAIRHNVLSVAARPAVPPVNSDWQPDKSPFVAPPIGIAIGQIGARLRQPPAY